MRVKYTLQAVQPISMADGKQQGNEWHTLRYIPGRVLRGAIIQVWKQKLGLQMDTDDTGAVNEIKQFFLSGDAIFPDMLSQNRTLEDAARYNCRICNASFDAVEGEELRGEQCKNKDTGEHNFIRSEAKYRFNDIKIEWVTKSQIDMRTATVMRERLYNFEYIIAGAKFTGEGRLSEEAFTWLQELSDIKDKNYHIIFVGKKRNSGFGESLLTIEPVNNNSEQDRKSELKEIMKKRDYIVLQLQSRALFIDHWLQHTIDISRVVDERYPVFLRLASQASQNGEGCYKMWAELEKLAGYNRISGVPAADEYVVVPGSIFKIRLPADISKNENQKDKLLSEMVAMEQYGIGMRTNEGYGKVYFYPERAQAGKNNDANNVSKELDAGWEKRIKVLAQAKQFYEEVQEEVDWAGRQIYRLKDKVHDLEKLEKHLEELKTREKTRAIRLNKDFSEKKFWGSRLVNQLKDISKEDRIWFIEVLTKCHQMQRNKEMAKKSKGKGDEK